MDDTQSPQGLLKFMAFMESLSPETCQALEDVYERELSFEDPINQASNIPELRALFEDLFKQLKQIRIEIKHHALGGKRHFISWHMAYTFRGKPRSLMGSVRSSSGQPARSAGSGTTGMHPLGFMLSSRS